MKTDQLTFPGTNIQAGLTTVTQIDYRKEEYFHITNLSTESDKLPCKPRSLCSDFYTLVFVKTGNGSVTVDDRSYTIQPSTIYFINVAHAYRQQFTKSGEVISITTNHPFLKRCLFSNPFEECPFLISTPFKISTISNGLFHEIEMLCKQLLNERATYGEMKYKIISTLFGALLLKINQNVFNDSNPAYQFSPGMQTVNKFKVLLEKHYNDITSGKVSVINRVQDYADAINLHPNYFNYIIKSKTGKSVGCWIIEKTIAEAKQMLREESLSIKQVSYRLGFCEVAHFSNYFKKYVGMSPAIFRKYLECVPT